MSGPHARIHHIVYYDKSTVGTLWHPLIPRIESAVVGSKPLAYLIRPGSDFRGDRIRCDTGLFNWQERSRKLHQLHRTSTVDCLSDEKGLQISFLHCGGTVMLVQACLSARKDRTKQFSSLWRSSEAYAGLFMCQE